MEKLKFREMTIEQVILSEEFKDLTVRDLIELFSCNISADTRTGAIKMKLRCRTDSDKRFNFMNDTWTPRFNHDNPFGPRLNSLSPQPLGYINPEQFEKKTEESDANTDEIDKSEDDVSESGETKGIPEDYKRKEICPNCGLYHECENVYDEDHETKDLPGFARLLGDAGLLALEAVKEILGDETKTATDKDKTPAPEDSIIIPFSQMDLPDLKCVLEEYYGDEISLEEIQKVWKLDDELELPVLRNLPICYGNIISLTFKIVDFNRHPKGSSFDKSLITLSAKYSIKENGVPIDLIPFIKYIEENDGISYFTI